MISRRFVAALYERRILRWRIDDGPFGCAQGRLRPPLQQKIADEGPIQRFNETHALH